MSLNHHKRGAGLNRRRFLRHAAVAGAGGIFAGKLEQDHQQQIAAG